jgi:hypothetical protein
MWYGYSATANSNTGGYRIGTWSPGDGYIISDAPNKTRNGRFAFTDVFDKGNFSNATLILDLAPGNMGLTNITSPAPLATNCHVYLLFNFA